MNPKPTTVLNQPRNIHIWSHDGVVFARCEGTRIWGRRDGHWVEILGDELALARAWLHARRTLCAGSDVNPRPTKKGIRVIERMMQIDRRVEQALPAHLVTRRWIGTSCIVEEIDLSRGYQYWPRVRPEVSPHVCLACGDDIDALTRESQASLCDACFTEEPPPKEALWPT